MPTQTIICLVVFVATLALYMSNKFPLPLVSMAAMGIYVITGCLEPKAALSCFSKFIRYYHGIHVYRSRWTQPYPDGP